MPVTTGVFQNEKIVPALEAAISEATTSIHIAVAWFSNYKIANALMEAKKRVPTVQIILSYDERNFLSNTYNLLSLEQQNIEIWGYSSDAGLMHHKFCVIDGRYLINGSFNWTYGANYKAKENIKIEDDLSGARSFIAIWSELRQEIMDGEIHRKPYMPVEPSKLRKSPPPPIVFDADKGYKAEIKRGQPTAFLFMVDQSGSMESGTISHKGMVHNKAEATARILNQTISELIGRSTKDYGIGDYIEICVIGYGGTTAQVAWADQLKGKTWVTPAELDKSSDRKEYEVTKNIRGKEIKSIETKHTWFDAKASGVTPMGSAFDLARRLLKEWIFKYPTSYPPTVINITDGESTDKKGAELLEAAQSITSLSTNDGAVLLFNCHLEPSSQENVLFPTDEGQLPDKGFSRLLFEMSSQMPSRYRANIAQFKNGNVNEPYVAMAFNSDFDQMIRLIEVGTRTATI